MMSAGVLLGLWLALGLVWIDHAQTTTTTTFATTTTVAGATAANTTASPPTTTTESVVNNMCEVLDGLQNMMMSYYDNATSRCYVVVGNDRSNYNSTIEKCEILQESSDGNWTCRIPNLDTTDVVGRMPSRMKMSYYFIGLRRPSCNDSWLWDTGANTTAAYKGNFTTLEAGEDCTFNNYVISATGITPAYMNYTTQTFCECGRGLNSAPNLHGISFSVLLLALIVTMTT